jgi:hypothetical protein
MDTIKEQIRDLNQSIVTKIGMVDLMDIPIELQDEYKFQTHVFGNL